ncbi:hypothetical protein FA13DRAFT_1453086 [Coprinellus micaceus]|uniref:F-box domain-containing protein n=1 Tax=Coprinellus micaceus TaxID=71717 RepID=A0A4Y7SNS8_COPMI|nr:hypothetical protein FA13DRAFT_1453086 [Coprinellus micaceus]
MSSLPEKVPIPRDDLPPTQASFHDLPQELLQEIVSQIRARHVVRTLRLVSHAFNEAAKGRAAESLSLMNNLDKVERMLSTPNTFDQSCVKLSMWNEDRPEDHYGWVVLAKLIRKMTGLHKVRWVVEGSVDGKVLESIAQLPLLESLDLVVRGFLKNLDRLMSLPTSTTRKLKSLSLQFPPLKELWNIPHAKAAVCYLIANAPTLERLNVGPIKFQYHNSGIYQATLEPLNIDALFAHIRSRGCFEPSLRSFGPLGVHFPSSPNAFHYFSKLSTLQISNHLQEHEAIWPALHTSGVRLKAISVQLLTSPLFEYLQNYHGLKSFHMGVYLPCGSLVLDQDVQLLLTHALPPHSATLTDLRILPDEGNEADRTVSAGGGGPNSTMSWNIPVTLANLSSLGRIQRLELVHTVVEMHDRGRKDALTSNIAAVISHASIMTNLEILHLNFIGSNLTGTQPRTHRDRIEKVLGSFST